MALEFDSQGFLKGDPIDLGRMPGYLRDIKDDVAAIRRAVVGGGNNANATRAARAPSTPQARDSSGRFVTKPVAAIPTGSARSVAALSALADSIGIAEGQKKKVLSQFKQGEKRSVSTPNRAANGQFVGGGASSSERSIISAFMSRFSGAARIGDGVEDIDPSIKAFREVAEPMQRGLEFFKGTKDSGEAKWLRKIFSKLNIFQKESSTFDKVQAKTLKSIDEKSGIGGGEDGSFGGGMAGGLLGRFLPWALGGLATAGAGIATVAGGAISTAIAAIFSPVGAAVAAAGVAAWGLFTEDGRKFFSDLGSIMTEKWGSFVDWMIQESPKTMEFLGRVGDTAKKSIDTVLEQASDAKKYLVESSPKTMESIEKAKGFGSKAIEAAKSAGNWVLGQTSKLFESGKGGAGTISNGKGDLGGASYGTYQLASKTGTLQQFLKSSKYGEQFSDLQPGTPEFNAMWKALASHDPEFGNAQHDFIKATHFDPAMRMLQKNGIDISGKGSAVQDSLWSTSVQFGAGGGANLVKKALAGKDVSSMSDSDIVSAIQDYKIANNERLFSSSSAQVRAGTASRAMAEKSRLLDLASVSVSSSTMHSAPKMPSPPPVADAPSIVQPLGTPKNQDLTINIPSQDIGRDIADRRMAHIVTGGIGGG